MIYLQYLQPPMPHLKVPLNVNQLSRFVLVKNKLGDRIPPKEGALRLTVLIPLAKIDW